MVDNLEKNDNTQTLNSNIEESLSKRIDFERKISQAIKYIRSSNEINYSDILKILGTALKSSSAAIIFFNPDNDIESVYSWSRDGVKSKNNLLLKFNLNYFPWLSEKVTGCENIIIPDVELLDDSAAAEKDTLKSLNIRAILAVPILFDGELKGYMGFDDITKTRLWNEVDAELLLIISEFIADQLKLIEDRIEISSTTEKLSRKVQQLSALNQIANLIIKNERTLNNVIDEIKNILDELYPAKVFGGVSLTIGNFTKETQYFNPVNQKFRVEFTTDVIGKCYIDFSSTDNLNEDEVKFEKDFTIALKNQIKILLDRNLFEWRIKESEKRYKDFFENDLTADFLTTVDGEILECNKAFTELFEIDAFEDISKMEAFRFYKKREDRLNFLNDLCKNRRLKNYEAAMITFKGRDLNVIENVEGIFNSSGHLELIRGYIFDISDREIFQKKLIKNEENYRMLFERNPYPMWVYDSETLKICTANVTAINQYGYSLEEFKSMSILDMRPEEEKEKLLDIMRNSGSRFYRRTGWKHTKKDGTVIDVEVTSQDIIYSGRDARLVIANDVTQAVQYEREMLKLKHAIEFSPMTVVITDTDGNIDYCNQSLLDITGYKKEEVIGKNPRIFSSGKPGITDYKALWQKVLNGESWHGEFLNKKKTGKEYWERAFISPIKNKEGKITNIVGIKSDISEIKEMISDLIESKDKAEVANKLKTEFLAQISHEIRSPLNTIMSFNEFIREEISENISEELNISFDAVNSASKRIITTVDKLLNMSELQLGIYDHSVREIDIEGSVIAPLYFEYKSNAKKKGLEFLLIKKTNKKMVTVDLYSVGQIFQNLIDNAINYTESGSVTIALTEKNSKLAVEVTDTGIGISSEFIPSLFEPFRQEEQGYTRKFEGTGLGLALVKKYCDLNELKIEVESEKDRGSTFRVLFNQ